MPRHTDRSTTAALAAAVVTAVGGFYPRPLLGYARTTTPAGAAQRWDPSCVSFTVHLDALPDVSENEARAAVTAAARAWTAEAIDCTGLLISLDFAPGPGPTSANDGRSTIGAREEGWCKDPRGHPDPATASSCWKDPSEMATTSVFAGNRDGRILDADVQLNAVTFHWGNSGIHPPGHLGGDLQSALAHEIGHALGLAHPCKAIGEPDRLDDRGQPLPDCYDAPRDLQQSVMFPDVERGSSPRFLSAEDQRAICEIYPRTAQPPACPVAQRTGGGGGCAFLARSSRGPGVEWLFAIVATMLRLRPIGRRVYPGRGRQRLGASPRPCLPTV